MPLALSFGYGFTVSVWLRLSWGLDVAGDVRATSKPCLKWSYGEERPALRQVHAKGLCLQLWDGCPCSCMKSTYHQAADAEDLAHEACA